MSTPLAFLVAGAGLACLLAALSWRVRSRRRARSLVRRGLLDPDPAVRRATVALAGEQGLSHHADLLAQRARQETDPVVLDALAEVVRRNQWEPLDDQRLVELRLWAHSRAEAGRADGAGRSAPARAEHDGRGGEGPRSAPAPAALLPREEVDGAETNGQRSSVGLLTADRPLDGDHDHFRPRRRVSSTSVRARRSDRPKAVVTGAGGPAGITVIRALQATGHPVVGVDTDGLAAGLRLAEQAAVVPAADDVTFVDALVELAGETGASILVPTLTEELVSLARSVDELTAAGLATWLPPAVAVETCMDKWRFAQALAANHLPGPATNLGTAQGVPGAWVVKPRFGRGSRGIHFVDRADELAHVLPRVPQPLVQTRLTGREFTVDALVDRDGTLVGAVPRWRLETKAGISTKGRTFDDDDLLHAVADLLTVLGMRGPANVQGFIAGDGTPSFIEVNPRFSGGLALSLAAGADLVGEYVRAIQGQPIQAERLAHRPGVTMIRHFTEIFE